MATAPIRISFFGIFPNFTIARSPPHSQRRTHRSLMLSPCYSALITSKFGQAACELSDDARAKTMKVLVVYDVLSKTLADISKDQPSIVINFELPRAVEDYIHSRRSSAKGSNQDAALTNLVNAGSEIDTIKSIKGFYQSVGASFPDQQRRSVAARWWQWRWRWASQHHVTDGGPEQVDQSQGATQPSIGRINPTHCHLDRPSACKTTVIGIACDSTGSWLPTAASLPPCRSCPCPAPPHSNREAMQPHSFPTAPPPPTLSCSPPLSPLSCHKPVCLPDLGTCQPCSSATSPPLVEKSLAMMKERMAMRGFLKNPVTLSMNSNPSAKQSHGGPGSGGDHSHGGDRPPSCSLKRSSDYDGRDSMNLQALQFLYSHHERAIKKQVDFDLHAVFLMQEFRPTDHIENIIRMIHECFTNQHPPQNALQQQLVDAATLVQNRINTFHTHSSSHTSNGQQASTIAEKAVQYLAAEGSTSVNESITMENNPIVA
ncbi:hypothetical protein PCASD_25889, partial [Puccinia coronata f. sp. avenae]